MSPDRWRDPFYLVLFIALVGAFWGVTLWQTREWVVAVQVMGSGVVISAAVTITVREVGEMLAEAFKKQMRELGRQEGRQEGRREILEQLVRDAVITEEQRNQLEADRKGK